MIIWLAIVNAQIFGYMENTGDCPDTGPASQFARFFDVSFMNCPLNVYCLANVYTGIL